MQPLAGIIVAGGLSRRLGMDKRKLRLWGSDGPTLLEHTLEVLTPLCTEVVVVLNDPQNWVGLPAHITPDIYADAGVLGGIYSGLCAVHCPYALVVAADMPFLQRDLLYAMSTYPRTYDVLLPRSLRPGIARNALNIEPLHAIYSRACLEPLRATLERGRRRIIDFMPAVKLMILEPDVIAAYDPHGRAFLSINTVAELAIAQQMIASDMQTDQLHRHTAETPRGESHRDGALPTTPRSRLQQTDAARERSL